MGCKNAVLCCNLAIFLIFSKEEAIFMLKLFYRMPKKLRIFNYKVCAVELNCVKSKTYWSAILKPQINQQAYDKVQSPTVSLASTSGLSSPSPSLPFDDYRLLLIVELFINLYFTPPPFISSGKNSLSILIIQINSVTALMDWKNKPNQIFQKVKSQMFSKGVETFTFLDKFVEDFDPHHTHQLTSHYLNLFLNKVGVFLSTQQIRNIRDLYSKNGIDLIAYKDFLEDVKYSISQKTAQLISQAFEKLDNDNKRSVQVNTLLKSYKADHHPHVLTRRKSIQEVTEAFKSAISRKVSNGLVSKQAFVDYYAELNFCIPNERQSYFQQLLTSTWGLVNQVDYVSERRLQELEFTLYQKIRLKSDGKTNEWKTAKKAISFFDLSDKGVADFAHFKRSLDKFGCNFKDNQIRALFTKYDTNGNGELDYEQFSKAIMDLDISGMSKQPNLLTTLGTNHFKVTH